MDKISHRKIMACLSSALVIFILVANAQAAIMTAGNNINLIGNLGFAVANSDELRFYPSNNISYDEIREGISDEADVTDKEKIPEGTIEATPVGPKIPGFGLFGGVWVLLIALYVFRKREWG